MVVLNLVADDDLIQYRLRKYDIPLLFTLFRTINSWYKCNNTVGCMDTNWPGMWRWQGVLILSSVPGVPNPRDSTPTLGTMYHSAFCTSVSLWFLHNFLHLVKKVPRLVIGSLIRKYLLTTINYWSITFARRLLILFIFE